MTHQPQPPMEEGCWSSTDPIIVSDKAMLRTETVSFGCEHQEQTCDSNLPDVGHYVKDQAGANSFLEDAIISFANGVEKRVAKVVRFPGICCRAEADLLSCLQDHTECTLECNAEVNAFTDCVQQQGPTVVSTRVKSIRLDKRKVQREKEISYKYNM